MKSLSSLMGILTPKSLKCELSQEDLCLCCIGPVMDAEGPYYIVSGFSRLGTNPTCSRPTILGIRGNNLLAIILSNIFMSVLRSEMGL